MSSFLEPDGTIHPTIAAVDLSSLLLKDLRVTTSVNHTSSTVFNNEPKLRRNIFPLSTISHKQEIRTLKLILSHYLTQAKGPFYTASHS
ncbi:hypothetical protein DEO72_LG7g766 [Vigna unguiculata]|uniref:Uncharacterized protein n=1 Tax=Vigna unguiculata TaxID=3917 RepID=A0A4D6MIB8_VIGUN|nr:hypothetical protein DEO72_LG7g766 [Vigna unguiculata]